VHGRRLSNKEDDHAHSRRSTGRIPWNKGKLTGSKPPLRPKNVWSIQTKLQVEGRTRDLAMFNFAIDSKLRACDLVRIKVEDVSPHGRALDRVTVRQKKTGHPVRFEMTEQTRQSIDEYIQVAGKNPGHFLFASRRPDRCISTRQYARIAAAWFRGIGLDPSLFGTHSLRRTKATLICRRTGNLRAVQLLLGHRRVESTVRYLGIEVDDALSISEQVDV
jgi:integrase